MGKFPIAVIVFLLTAANRQSLAQTQNPCPAGYAQQNDGSCQPDQQLRCPPGTVFINEKCRKIICPMGELYNGMCLMAACPPGLVWRGKRCQDPGFLTTILEIENVLTNDMHENALYYENSVHNGIIMDNSTLATIAANTPPPTTTTTTTRRPPSTRATTPNVDQGNATSCCTLRTPRICKRYNQKWICFNRSQKRCDPRVCTAPIVYLKAPEIKYTPPLLIMPPDAIAHTCEDGTCDQSESTLPDCSGCAVNHPENCSRYCFMYICPPGTCSYMNLDLYCSYYPGQFGCIKEDGCLWNWC